MKNTKLILGARILLGLIFTIFGLNGFLGFMPMPPMPESAGAFLGALAATGYMFPLIKGFEVLSGLMLLSGFQVPLALLFLAPISINIFLFHFILTGPSTAGLGALILALIGILAYGYWERYQGIFRKA